ncbi:hypothetical protein HDU96_001926 [Phlyctochytrium bullatum]|nr:hypothetical protein HDU96_001926 [Phlyctochytrium bullatum]
MTDYWKSTNKYWCDYCKIFVVDNKISRTNHETSAKHKERVQRFIREIDKKERSKQFELDKTKSILKGIEMRANASMGGQLVHSLKFEQPAAASSTAKPFAASSSSTVYVPEPKVNFTTGIGDWEVVEEIVDKASLHTHLEAAAAEYRAKAEEAEEKAEEAPAVAPREENEPEPEHLSTFRLQEKKTEVEVPEDAEPAAPVFKKRRKK